MVCTSRAQGACSRSASAKHLCAVHSQVRESDVVDLLRVTFTNNSALVGGAVGVYLATRLSIRDCTFSNNIATVLGCNPIHTLLFGLGLHVLAPPSPLPHPFHSWMCGL